MDHRRQLIPAPSESGRGDKRKYQPERRTGFRSVREMLAASTGGLDSRWFCGAPDLSESPLAYKDTTKVKAQIAQFEGASRELPNS